MCVRICVKDLLCYIHFVDKNNINQIQTMKTFLQLFKKSGNSYLTSSNLMLVNTILFTGIIANNKSLKRSEV